LLLVQCNENKIDGRWLPMCLVQTLQIDKHREWQRDTTSVEQKLVEMKNVVNAPLLQTPLTMGKMR